LREKHGQSQQQLADAVGVSKVYVWKLEKGRNKNPSLDLLVRLAEHFKVSIAYFQDDTNAAEDAEALQFFRDFRGKLSEKDWRALRDLAETMKSKDFE
jgi:transcriptional regulator with XRE-family HTH domain